MNIGEAIEDVLTNFDYDYVIFAKRPWTSESEAIIDKFEDGFATPNYLIDKQYEYFLEAGVVEELADVKKTRIINSIEFIEMVIHYAEFDCAPDWIDGLPLT